MAERRYAPRPPTEPHPDDLRGAPPTPTPAERHAYKHAAKTPAPPVAKTLDDLDDTVVSLPTKIYRAIFGAPISDEVRRIRRARKTDAHVKERATMAIVAVFFLWMTSLGVARSLVNRFVVGPDFNCVVAEVESAGYNMFDEKARYEECATRKTTACQAEFILDLATERERTIAALDANALILQQYEAQRLGCSRELVRSTNILDAIQKNVIDAETGQAIDLRRNYSTPEFDDDPRCALVDQLILGQGAALGALATSADFQLAANLNRRSLSDDIDARVDYDKEYLYNKTNVDMVAIVDYLGTLLPNIDGPFGQFNASYDMYVACMTTGVYNGVECDGGMVEKMENMLNQGRSTYRNVYDQAAGWAESATATVDGVLNFFDSLNGNVDLWTAIDATFITFTGGGLNGLGWNSGLGFSTLDVPSFGIPGVANAYDDIQAAYAETTENLKSAVAEQQRKLKELRDAVRLAQLFTFNATFFDDYDPPLYNNTEAEAVWLSSTKHFLPGMSDELDAVERESGDEESFRSTLNSTNLAKSASAFAESLKNREFDLYFYPDDWFQNLYDGWNRIEWLLFFFDYLYRAIHTLVIIRKYWRVSRVLVPPADIRVSTMKKTTLGAPTSRSPQQWFAYFVTHPVFNAAIFLLFFGLAVSTFLKLYLPIYNEYVTGCVQGQFAGTGTMITRNSFTIASQFSASDGDKVTTIAVDRINVDRELECTDNLDLSLQVTQEHDDEYKFQKERHDDLVFKVGGLRTCLDINAIQLDFPTYTSVDGNGKLGHTLLNSTYGANCNATLPPLPDATFKCDNIDECAIFCEGINEPLLQSSVHDAGCQAEWLGHSIVLGYSMIVIVYVTINLARVFFLKGMVRRMWRFLSMPRFAYIGTTLQGGELLYPEEVTEEGLSMEETIESKLETGIMSYQRMGLVFMGCAVLANIPWLALLIHFGDTLEFTSEAACAK